MRYEILRINWNVIRVIILIHMTTFDSLAIINTRDENPYGLSANVILYENRTLQVEIKWNNEILNGSSSDIIITPYATDYCVDIPCYKYDISNNLSEVIIPENNMIIMDKKECYILPGCMYNISIKPINSDLVKSKPFKLIIPECVDSYCSCAHEKFLPNITISAKMESPNVTIVSWNITTTFNLPYNISLRSLKLRLSKESGWGDDYHVSYSINLVENPLIGSTKIEIPSNHLDDSKFLIKGHVVDSNECEGQEGKFSILVPIELESYDKYNIGKRKSLVINQTEEHPYNLSANVILYNIHTLQVEIKWNKEKLNGSKSYITITPYANDYCGDKPCYQYDISNNLSEVIIPKNVQELMDNSLRECLIMPGCIYDISIEPINSDLVKSNPIQLIVPECVGSFCSCLHVDYLPNITISAKIESSDDLIVSWNITPSFNLPNNISLKTLELRLSSLPWGADYNVSDSISLLQNPLIGTTKMKIPPNHLVDTTYLIKGHVVDSSGCPGREGIFSILVPLLARNEDLQLSENNMWILGIIIPILLSFLILIFLLPKIIRKIRKKYEVQIWRGVYHNVPNSTAPNIMMQDNFLYVDKDILEARSRGEADQMEIPHSALQLGSEIGKGAFGRVLIARADNIGGKPGKQYVAVKQLKKRPNADELEEFLAEIATMKKVGRHPNIVNLLGCCTIKQPLLMIMEFVGCGDLLQYLRKIRAKHEERSACVSGVAQPSAMTETNFHPLNPHSHNFGKYLDILHTSSSNSDASYITQPDSVPSGLRPSVTETMYTTLGSLSSTSNSLEYVLDHNELHMFAVQISRGMRHLEEKQITHRDLAARNILIDENKNLKISDFGLSRSGIYVNTRNKKVPLRWLSIEAMRDNLYSSKSDVWALGIVLWEIGTLGGYPYPTVGNHELLPFLASGGRLQRPENCSKHLYEVMLHCWSEKPEDRPTFAELVTKLEPQQQKIYIDFNEIGPDYVFPPTFEKI